MQTNESKILARIVRSGKGNAFTPKDFLDIANYEAAKKSLLRLNNAGRIRRTLRGVYDYPRFSAVRKGPASPDPDAIARAIARAHGWTLTPTGETALNLLGLSTQVPAKWQFLTDGPPKKYTWDGGSLQLIHRAGKDAAGLSPTTALVVQALKTLGKAQVNEDVMRILRNRLHPRDRTRALREARYTTAWVYEAIKQLAGDGPADA